jgi:hypothetical protein
MIVNINFALLEQLGRCQYKVEVNEILYFLRRGASHLLPHYAFIAWCLVKRAVTT